jgi:hypothetical protein
VFTADWVLKMPAEAVRTGRECPRVLYLSADSDEGTVGVRTLAATTGETVDRVDELIRQRFAEGRPEAMLERLAEATRHVSFSFIPSLTMPLVLELMWAHLEKWGAYPDLLVVDNLSDVSAQAAGTVDGHEGFTQVCKELKDLARDARAAVLVAHHVTGSAGGDGDKPIGMAGVLGQATRHQRLVLTLHTPTPGRLGVSVVKNSNGPMSGAGHYGVVIEADTERMRFGGSDWEWIRREG